MRRVTFCIIAVLGILQVGCGGGGSAGGPPPPPPAQVAVSVSPSSAALLTTETQQFTATVTGSANTAVTWSVNGTTGGNATVGTINANGLYSAPATPPAGNITIQATSVAAPTATASAAATVTAPLVTAFAAARFLEQATFGPTPGGIRQVQLVGFDQFLAGEFSAPSSVYPDPDADPNTSSPTPYQQRFFTNALAGPDQLRQRVAFALQKIWVVSWIVVNTDEGYLTYLRMHQQHPFASYRQIMENVTLNPAMGQYQDIANNDKALFDAQGNIVTNCNENYGRELMQLFTVGIWQLNQDGSLILDGQGNPTPTYDQAIVEANACALTGWTYANAPGQNRNWPRPRYFGAPLEAIESHHDTRSKTLLNNFTLPAGQTAAADLRDTLDNLNTYPSIAPFVSKLLIQQFTTSNPSPAHVRRVAQTFTNGRYVSASRTFGGGTRGDMQAIIAAILLDPEARAADDPAVAVTTGGRLKEPVLYMTGLLRAFATQTDGSNFATQGNNMGQRLFFAPTVFSYFSPEYQIPATSLLGPEFQLHNSATTLARLSFANSFAFGTIGGTTLDFAPYVTLAGAGTTQLLDALDRLLLHGTMSAAMRGSITNAVNAVPAANPLQRAQTAIYLVISSSQFQVQR